MHSSKFTRSLFWSGEVLLLAGTLVAGVWISSISEWSPGALVGLLLVLALVGEWFSVEINDGHLSASLVAIVLAMSLLGPAPAAACGIAAMIHRSAMGRLSLSEWLSNLSMLAAVPFLAGWVIRAAAGNVHDPHNHLPQSVIFGLIVFGVYSFCESRWRNV